MAELPLTAPLFHVLVSLADEDRMATPSSRTSKTARAATSA